MLTIYFAMHTSACNVLIAKESQELSYSTQQNILGKDEINV